MTTSRQPPEGRVYHLRPRGPVAEQAISAPADNVIRMIDRVKRRAAASRPLAQVEAYIVAVDAGTLFDYAWAVHQRVHPRQGVSFRRVLTGAKTGTAQDLLYTRKAARMVPECESLMEAVHLNGRPIVEAHLAAFEWIAANDGHDCDCTCAGLPDHGRWEISAPAWRHVDAGALFRALVHGDAVKVRLGAVGL